MEIPDQQSIIYNKVFSLLLIVACVEIVEDCYRPFNFAHSTAAVCFQKLSK